MGLVLIDNEEYKNLILREKELEETKEKLEGKQLENISLEEKYIELEEELKELILVATDNKESFFNRIESYNIEDVRLAEYLSKYYLNNRQLKFRKRNVGEKQEEVK